MRATLHDGICGPLRVALPRMARETAGLTWYGQHDAWWIGHYDAWRRAGLVSFARAGRLLGQVTMYHSPRLRDIPPEGIEVLRSAAGGNPHTLIADPGTCRWNPRVFDDTGLSLGALTATAPVYLIHPEHGAAGIAPGRYVLRRQREYSGDYRGVSRLVAD